MIRATRTPLSLLIFGLLSLALLSGKTTVAQDDIQPTWESLAENYEVPQWFVDGKIGVWFHWGISSAAAHVLTATRRQTR